MERFAAIDFETANGKRSSICSIGIAILEDDWVVDSIYTLVRPTPNFYTRWTTAIHGLSAEDTNDALCFEEAWESIAPKLKDLPLVAHNSPFDEGCLKAAHEVYDLAYPKYPFYCTCRLSRKMYPFLVNHQLQTVAAHCGYDLTRHHNAMATENCFYPEDSQSEVSDRPDFLRAYFPASAYSSGKGYLHWHSI